MSIPSPIKIKNCVTRAIKSANFEYEKLSSGEWVSARGVESYVAYFVATALSKVFVPRSRYAVRLEVSINELEQCYVGGAKLRGRRGKDRYKGNRIDVVVIEKISGEWHAVGLVELKRNELVSKWASDVDRVSNLLRRYSARKARLRWGCFAAFVSETKSNLWIKKKWEQEWQPFLRTRSKGLDHELICSVSKFKKYEDDGEEWRFAIVGSVYRAKS